VLTFQRQLFIFQCHIRNSASSVYCPSTFFNAMVINRTTSNNTELAHCPFWPFIFITVSRWGATIQAGPNPHFVSHDGYAMHMHTVAMAWCLSVHHKPMLY